MKKLITNYTFNPTERKITFNDYEVIELERVLLITNVTRNEIIYSFADPSKGGNVSGNVLILNYDTTEMNADDKLQIWYEDPSVPALDDGLLKALLENIASNTGNLDVTLSTLASQSTLEEIWNYIQSLYYLLQALLHTPISRLAIDGANRLRAVVENTVRTVVDNTVPVSQAGTWNLGNFPVDQRWEMIQRANIEYNECQRSKFTF